MKYGAYMTTDNDPPKRLRGRPRKPPPENPEPKRPRGRPSLGHDAKIQNVTIRLAPDDYDRWRQMARERGITLTEFILAPLRKELAKRKGKP